MKKRKTASCNRKNQKKYLSILKYFVLLFILNPVY